MESDGAETVRRWAEMARGRQVNVYISGAGVFREACSPCTADGVDRRATQKIRIEAVFGQGIAMTDYYCDQHFEEFRRHDGRRPEHGFGFGLR